MALAKGYEVLRRGWPDFCLVKGEEVIFVEVKSLEHGGDSPAARLTPDQVRMCKVLQRMGMLVYIAVDGNLNDLCDLDDYLEEVKPQGIRKVG